MRRAQAETLIDVGDHDARGARRPAAGDASAPGCSRTPASELASRASATRPSCSCAAAARSRYLFELLPDEEERGFRLLPAPDAGDVWFDMEGHPFYETSRGLEYLFGYCFRDDAGEVVYEAVWGRDRDGERVAFEQFVDWVVARRARLPGHARLPLRRLRALGADPPRWASTAPASRRSTTSCARRCSSTSTASSSSRCAPRPTATRSRRSRSSTASCAPPRCRAATSRSSASRSGSRPATTRSSRRSSATTRRTAARRSSCTSGCARSGPPSVPWRLPPDQRAPTEEAEERDAAREALKARLLDGRGGGRAAAAAREPARLPPARAAARVVGVVPLAAARRRRARSATAPRSAGSSGTGSRPRSRDRATPTG